ncbi:hypothetical protein BTVI_157722 [Pitangus sulphuratus]|nr:hypothetical protein BTVI_157722 [Pitangus sulphuratus]
MIISLHEDQRGQVRYGDTLSEPFPIANGVKQGCVLAPTLFTVFFSMMLQRAMADLDDGNGVYIRYRTDGSLFNLRRLKVHIKTLNHLIHELLYADDATLVAHTEVKIFINFCVGLARAQLPLKYRPTFMTVQTKKFRLDEVLIAWFYEGKSLKSELFVCISIEMTTMAMGLTLFLQSLGSQTSGKGTTLRQGLSANHQANFNISENIRS